MVRSDSPVGESSRKRWFSREKGHGVGTVLFVLCKGKQDQSRPSWNHEAVGGGGVWGVWELFVSRES